MAVARALTCRPVPVDVNETLGLRWLAPDDVRGLVVGNEIPDGLSLTALSWAPVAGVIC